MDAFEHVVGIDWGSQAHQVCLVAAGRRPEQRQLPHRAAGLAALVGWLREACSDPSTVAVGIEVPHGAIVETLQERGFAVFSLNPKQLDRFRDRHSVSGAKDDRRDAFVLADALRSERHKFKRVRVPDATSRQRPAVRPNRGTAALARVRRNSERRGRLRPPPLSCGTPDDLARQCPGQVGGSNL